MDVVVERPGALDVHKASVTGCVRVPDLASCESAGRAARRQADRCGLLLTGHSPDCCLRVKARVSATAPDAPAPDEREARRPARSDARSGTRKRASCLGCDELRPTSRRYASHPTCLTPPRLRSRVDVSVSETNRETHMLRTTRERPRRRLRSGCGDLTPIGTLGRHSRADRSLTSLPDRQTVAPPCL